VTTETKLDDLSDADYAELYRPIGIQTNDKGETFAWTLLSDLPEKWRAIARAARAKDRAGIRGRADPDHFGAMIEMPPVVGSASEASGPSLPTSGAHTRVGSQDGAGAERVLVSKQIPSTERDPFDIMRGIATPHASPPNSFVRPRRGTS
jgi:hypothetical protein